MDTVIWKKLKVTSDTLFAIGSSTKAFTAIAAAQLVDEGLLDWDQPVNSYLQDFQMFDPVATDRLTMRDMLCHRSGLPRHEMVWYNSLAPEKNWCTACATLNRTTTSAVNGSIKT